MRRPRIRNDGASMAAGAVVSKRDAMRVPMRRAHEKAVFLAMAVAVVHATAAQPGPPGGYITAIAVDPKTPSIVYAATSCGLFKTSDGGTLWRAVLAGACPVVWSEASFPAPGPFGPWQLAGVARALALDPSNPSIVYSGRLKSEDAGATWKEILDSWRIPNDLGPSAVAVPTAWAIDPVNPSVVYGGFAAGRGLVKSVDAGATFTSINSGLPVFIPGPDQSRTMGDVVSICVDPANSATLYIAANRGGVFKSGDAGSSWSRAGAGLTSDVVSALVLDRGNPSTLYAAAYGEGGGVFKSIDAGLRWTRAGANFPETDVLSLAIAPSDPATLYAGTASGWIYRSTDAGETWVAINSGLPRTGFTSLATAPDNASVLYAGSYGGGIFRTGDAGRMWTHLADGLAPAYVRGLAVDAQNSRIYAGTSGGGVFRTGVQGEWRAANNGLLNAYIESLAIDPADPRTLYAGTAGGLYKSGNSGESWMRAGAGIPDHYYAQPNGIREVVVDPVDSANLYARTAFTGAYRSTDAGATWHEIDVPHRIGTVRHAAIASLAVDPIHPSTVFAGFDGVYKSTDRGATWSRVDLEIRALALAFDRTGVLYAVGGVGCAGGWAECAEFYRSSDGGRSWTRTTDSYLGIDISSDWKLAIDPGSNTIYCFGASHGVFRSNDGGVTWTAIYEGLPDTMSLALTVDANVPRRIYAGTTAGVYVSHDEGRTWHPKLD